MTDKTDQNSALEATLQMLLKTCLDCAKKFVTNQSTCKQLQAILFDYSSCQQLAEMILHIANFTSKCVTQGLVHPIPASNSNAYELIEKQLQSQQSLYRNLVKTSLLDKQQLLQLEEANQAYRAKCSELDKSLMEAKATLENVVLDKTRMISRMQHQLNEKDLLIAKLQAKLGLVQNHSMELKSNLSIGGTTANVKVHRRRKSDEPVKSCTRRSQQVSSKSKK